MTQTSSNPQTSVQHGIEYDLSEMQPRREFAVILFDDDEHSPVEVIIQLMKALRCSVGRAKALVDQVEEDGRATVAIATRHRALHIAAILRQIQLHIGLRQIN